MKVSVIPSVSQIRYYAQSALNSFDTLDAETAATVAQSDLRALIRYLDALDHADDASAVFVSGGVKPVIVLEDFICDGE